MELRHLKYFSAVAEELHFGKAADRLKISQPPLSQQIKQIESELGVVLFYRTKRKVELSEAGKVFLKRSHEILDTLNKTCVEVQRVHKGEIGELILGFGDSVTFDLLPHILQVFRNSYPDVKIALRPLSTTDQIKALHRGEIHIGLLVPPVNSVLLDIRILREEPLITVLPKGHPLAKEKSIEISRLANELFIMTPREQGPGYYDSIISICHEAGFTPKTSQEVEQLHTILSLVSSEMGIALMPASMKLLKNDGIVYKQLKNSSAKIKRAVAWNKNNKVPVVDSFLDLIR